MTAQEFAAWRTEVGVSGDDLAKAFNVAPTLIEKWETGRVAIAQRFVDALPAVARSIQGERLIASSGLPQCSVAEAFRERVVADEASPERMLQDARGYLTHVKTCPVCQAREQFLTERLGPSPQPDRPTGFSARIVGAIGWCMLRLPEWLRPAAGGAAILFAIVLSRLLFAVTIDLVFHHGSADWGQLALVPVVAALGGAAGGFGYTILGKPLGRVPVAGPYLAGVATIMIYVLSIMWAISVASTNPKDRFGSDTIPVAIIVAIIFGLILGPQWFAGDGKEPRRRGTVGA